MKTFPLYTNNESTSIESYCHQSLSYPKTTLMGMAALSVFHANEDLWSTAEEIWIAAGTGGNGGDGYALANILFEEGYSVKIFQIAKTKRDDSRFFFDLCVKAGIPIFAFTNLETEARHVDAGSILLVDAILGTGFKDKLSNELQSIINWINNSPHFFYKLSLDTPTGYHADSKSDVFIEADSIEELGTRKWENIGFTLDDKIVPRYYESLGFPTKSYQDNTAFSNRYYWDKADFEEVTPLLKRKINAHKYSSGSAIFFGGEEGMHGAILLSASAFQNLGGGISKLFTPSEATRNCVLLKDPSKMASFSDGEDISQDPFFFKANTFVAGPGLSKYPPFLEHLILRENQTLILDAGAIPKVGQKFPSTGNIVFTPHVGEFERLTGKKCLSVQSAYEVASEFCLKNKVSILYKSFVSMLVTRDGWTYIWESPNPQLATMGSGDLLVGILSRFFSLGYSTPESVYYSLSLLEGIREMPETYPSAYEMLQFLMRKI